METEDFINLRLLSHPMNWFIVWTVFLFVGAAWMMLHRTKTQNANPAVAVHM